MSWGFGWKPYVSVAQRRANAAKEASRLARKGRTMTPVRPAGRAIATTFWGKSWCDNLESYSDFANRLPRGRSYIRNGSVVDLQIAPGKITALVSGSSLYTIEIKIRPLPKDVWTRVQRACAGQIDSLIEMLQGRLSSKVMQTVTRREDGLFPKPGEIEMDCSCPDWAGMCKHVAAALYGVGVRLDDKPELLFHLRGVDPAELISKASAAEAVRQTKARTTDPHLSEAHLADVFGIELDTPPAPPSAAKPAIPKPARPKNSKRRATLQRRTSKTQRKIPGKRKSLRKRSS